MSKNYTRQFYIRFILVVVLPIILSFFIFFDPNEKIPLSKDDNNEVKISEDIIDQPSFKNAIRDIFQVPFDLKWYEICFENKDTKLIYENGEIEKSVNVTLNFNDNQEKFLVPYGETKCKLYKFNKNFIYRWEFEYSVPIFGGVKMHPDLDSYAKPEFKGIIVKNILFIFTWFGLSLLILEIWKFIKFGREK